MITDFIILILQGLLLQCIDIMHTICRRFLSGLELLIAIKKRPKIWVLPAPPVHVCQRLAQLAVKYAICKGMAMVHSLLRGETNGKYILGSMHTFTYFMWSVQLYANDQRFRHLKLTLEREESSWRRSCPAHSCVSASQKTWWRP